MLPLDFFMLNLYSRLVYSIEGLQLIVLPVFDAVVEPLAFYIFVDFLGI